MTKEILEAQDNILRQAWKEGALYDAWFNKWIEEVYAQQAKNISLNPDVSGQLSCPKCTSTNVKSDSLEHTCQYCGTMWAR